MGVMLISEHCNLEIGDKIESCRDKAVKFRVITFNIYPIRKRLKNNGTNLVLDVRWIVTSGRALTERGHKEAEGMGNISWFDLDVLI